MGLITDILLKEEFERRCVQESRALCQPDLYTLKTTKRLTYRFKDELQHYFADEAELMDFHIRRCSSCAHRPLLHMWERHGSHHLPPPDPRKY